MARGSRPYAGRAICPHPDCDHVGDYITKVHCRMAHNMEREDLFQQYGQPTSQEIDSKRFAENRRVRTILPNNTPVLSGQKKGATRI